MTTNIIHHEYHRNGIAGEGFFAVTFTTEDGDDDKGKTFLAVVTQSEAYVMQTKDGVLVPDSKWRGTDYFHQPLVEALSKARGYNVFE